MATKNVGYFSGVEEGGKVGDSKAAFIDENSAYYGSHSSSVETKVVNDADKVADLLGEQIQGKESIKFADVGPTHQLAGYTLVKGTFGDDPLHGDELSNTYLGLSGDDTMYGSPNFDVMYGGFHDDLYVIGPEDDYNIISDVGVKKNEKDGSFHLSQEDAGNDTLEFDDGIKRGDIAFFLNDSDLIIDTGKNARVRIVDQTDSNHAIETIMVDGYYLSSDDVNKVVAAIASHAREEGF